MTILQFILTLIQIFSGIISIFAIVSLNKTNSELGFTIKHQQDINDKQQQTNENVERKLGDMNDKIINSLYKSLEKHTESIIELAGDIKILVTKKNDNGKTTDKTKRI